jgi:hypothetical protein
MYDLYISQFAGSSYDKMNSFSLEGVRLVRYRDEDSIRVRDKIQGDITFYGADYKTLLSLRDGQVDMIYAYFELSGARLIDFVIELSGTWREGENVCQLPTYNNDAYTTLKKNLNKKRRWTGQPYTKFLQMNQGVYGHRMFQKRQVNSPGSGTNTAKNDELYTFCQSSDNNQISRFDITRDYKACTYKMGDGNGTGWMCDMTLINNSFVYVIGAPGIRWYYACKQDCKGRPPGGAFVQTAYWAFVGTNVTYSAAHEMGTEQSDVYLEGAKLDDVDGKWKRGGCSAGTSILISDINGVELERLFRAIIQNADNSLDLDTNYLPYITDAEKKNLVLHYQKYDGNGAWITNEYEYDFEQLAAIYKAIFNVEWRIENSMVVLRHPSEFPKSASGLPLHDVTTYFSEDFSSQEFSSQATKFYLERFSFGKSKDPDFGAQEIVYDNTYEDISEAIVGDFDTDLVFYSSLNKDRADMCILQYDSSDMVLSALDISTGLMNYNLNMKLFDIIQDHHLYDRLYSKGNLRSRYDNSKEKNIQSVRKRNLKATIQTPVAASTMFDFDKYLVTNYGNLYLLEASTDLDSGVTTITASK